MAEIVPAILERDFKEVKRKLGILRGRARTVQIDICDGIFTPSMTWPFSSGGFDDIDFRKIINEEEGMPLWQDFDFEIDLMVSNALKDFDLFAKLGAKRVIFHLAAFKETEALHNFLEGIDVYVRDQIEIGLAFRPSDDMSVVRNFSSQIDFLQSMGSDRVGFQGEALSEKALLNIRALKKELPDIVISLDIGVNLANVKKVAASGVDRIAVGSGIWKEKDPILALETLQSLV